MQPNTRNSRRQRLILREDSRLHISTIPAYNPFRDTHCTSRGYKEGRLSPSSRSLQTYLQALQTQGGTVWVEPRLWPAARNFGGTGEVVGDEGSACGAAERIFGSNWSLQASLQGGSGTGRSGFSAQISPWRTSVPLSAQQRRLFNLSEDTHWDLWMGGSCFRSSCGHYADFASCAGLAEASLLPQPQQFASSSCPISGKARTTH